MADTYTRILLSDGKRSSHATLTTWMELEGLMLSKIVRRRGQLPSAVTYMWNIQEPDKGSDKDKLKN